MVFLCKLYVVGLFWKRANGQGAFAAIIVGVLLAIFFFIFGDAGWMPEIHFLYVAGILFTICCLTIFIVSLLTDPPAEEKINDYTWSKKMYEMETNELSSLPFYKNYRFHSMMLLILVVIILVYLW